VPVMSVMLKCSLLGESAVLGCGVSQLFADEVEEEIVVSHSSDSKAEVERAQSQTGCREGKARSRHSRPSDGNAAAKNQQVPSSAFLTRDVSLWHSCDSESALAEPLRRSASPNVAEGAAAETHDLGEESTIVGDAASSTGDKSSDVGEVSVNTSNAAPQGSADAAQAGHEQRICELRERLSDVLGPSGSLAFGDADANTTMDCFGGERTCCWRFLKSCHNDKSAAERKLRKTLKFRETERLNSRLQESAGQEIWDELRHLWPEQMVGTTSGGSPVSCFDIRKAVQFLQLGLSEVKVRGFWLSWMERNLELQRRGRSRASDHTAAQDMPGTVVIYNLDGLCLSQLTSCLSGLHVFCRVVGLAEEHYPQSLRKAIVVNVPSIFGKMVWPLVQKVLDAETRSNIFVCSGSDHESLTSEDLGFGAEEFAEFMSRVL